MAAPTYLLVAGFKDAPKTPERDYDPDLDGERPEDDKPIPKKRGRTRTTNVSRAGIRIGTDEETGQPLSQGGFSNPIKRRVERMRSSSGFTKQEEQELKQGFAAIQGLMTGQPVEVPTSNEPTDAEIELVFSLHEFQGGPRTQYCRMPGCFKARADKVHG